MKKRLLIVSMLALIPVLVLGGTGIAAEPTEAQPASATTTAAPTASLAGEWSAYGQWYGSGSWNWTWTITQSGALIHVQSSSGADWYGLTSGEWVLMKINSGCYPLHIGKASQGDTYMQGLMVCTDQTGWGVWEAFLMPDSPGPKTSSGSAAEDSPPG